MRYITVLLLMLIGFACSDNSLSEDLIAIELKAGEEYVLNLGLQRAIFRPEGIVEAEFITQARKASSSELQFVITGLGLEDPVLYRYSPEPGFTGIDYVEFVVCYSEDCESEDAVKEFYRIQFLVRN